MDPEGKARLAIRTVVITTRAAVAAHMRAGREEQSRESADQGLTLLRSVRSEAERAGTMGDYELAEMAIRRMADSPRVAIPVAGPVESHASRPDQRSREAPCEAG